MNLEQLRHVLKYILSSFNDEGVKISDNTIHEAVLSDSDGFSAPATSKRIYKTLVRWTLSRNGHSDKPWPVNWMKLSISELSEHLL